MHQITDMSSVQLNVTTNTDSATVTIDGVTHDQSTLATVTMGAALTAKLVTVVVTSAGSDAQTYTGALINAIHTLALSLWCSFSKQNSVSVSLALSFWLCLCLSGTCTCCDDQIKGTQDKDFSYSFSDSLSASLSHRKYIFGAP